MQRVARWTNLSSMNASVVQWLTGIGEMPRSYRVPQGTRLGQSGDIAIIADDGGTVWVVGATTTCFRGMAAI